MITETAFEVLKRRYFVKSENSWEELVERVAKHFSKNEKEFARFRSTLFNLDFLPNSPALMNAGTGIESYSACYVLPVEDNIESIFKFYSDAAKISKSGGGVGANFSKLRAENSNVNSTNGVASGPISFMSIQDKSTEVIKQGGRRRGANMGILNCDHGDILNFIRVKDTPKVLENFNLSVGLTDKFMSSLEEPDNKVLWDELVQRAWSSAEPGVVFLDRLEDGNTTPHLGEIEATNPCRLCTIQ